MYGPVSSDGSFYLAGELPCVWHHGLSLSVPRSRIFETFAVAIVVEDKEVLFRVFENCVGHRLSVNYDIRLPDIIVTTGGTANE
jgi:hypothetical protein